MILLTDPTLVSINHIQQAHKQADNGFNDIVAQLYKEEFSKQEKAKEEHVKQAKEKAIELQRIEEENRKKAEQEAERVRKEQLKAKYEAERIEQERQEASKIAAGTGIIGNSWTEVSPEQAAQYMASKTGVAASKWKAIIYAESTNNPYVTNQIGCYGYLQLHPVHGNVSGMSPQQYLDTAVSVYNSQDLSAWEVTTNGMVN